MSSSMSHNLPPRKKTPLHVRLEDVHSLENAILKPISLYVGLIIKNSFFPFFFLFCQEANGLLKLSSS